MPFLYRRTVHFPDTDAAGVVFFANYLSFCHEAYEEALAAAGVELNRFFRETGTIIPVSKAEAEYFRPLATGDRVEISVTPRSLTEASFELRYELTRAGTPPKRVGAARTEHVCIDAKTRSRVPLPPAVASWVNAG